VNSVGVIYFCVNKSHVFKLLYELFSPVQSGLVGIILVSVSGGLQPGKHHRREGR